MSRKPGKPRTEKRFGGLRRRSFQTSLAAKFDRSVLNSYSERNRILDRLGFKSYASYLGSRLWREIRGRVLLAATECWACGNRRRKLQIHHNAYTEDNLSGKSLVGLHAICAPCHQRAEFNEGKKVTVGDACDRLFKKRQKALRRAGFSVMCLSCKINRSHQGGPCPPCRARAAREAESVLATADRAGLAQ